MSFLGVLLLAVVMNLDSFAVGLAYCMAGFRLPWFSRLLISGASGLVLAGAMLLGEILGNLVSPMVLHYLPGSILLLIGMVLFWQTQGKKQQKGALIWQVRLPFLGVMIQILREPALCDKNEDHTIWGKEALCLGTALALDSWGIGLALGIGAYPFWATILIVVAVEFLLLTVTGILGEFLCHQQHRWQGTSLCLLSSYLPSLVLLGLGLVKILF